MANKKDIKKKTPVAKKIDEKVKKAPVTGTIGGTIGATAKKTPVAGTIGGTIGATAKGTPVAKNIWEKIFGVKPKK